MLGFKDPFGNKPALLYLQARSRRGGKPLFKRTTNSPVYTCANTGIHISIKASLVQLYFIIHTISFKHKTRKANPLPMRLWGCIRNSLCDDDKCSITRQNTHRHMFQLSSYRVRQTCYIINEYDIILISISCCSHHENLTIFRLQCVSPKNKLQSEQRTVHIYNLAIEGPWDFLHRFKLCNLINKSYTNSPTTVRISQKYVWAHYSDVIMGTMGS